MTKICELDFDDCILDALRDKKLVIFAGAGVSMGAPSNLSSFKTLASDIARGTKLVLSEKEPLDRFLGRLQHKGVLVHERAVQFLSPQISAPTTLHYDILRLFRSSEHIRLVTTNFDLHFESAAKSLFEQPLEIYRAPALPMGGNFNGIVHVHGSISKPNEMVLTDSDFGRAYLTEGWARRFLVDVFRNFTVLFIGYSHDDVVMNYLARALPTNRVAGRFALTENIDNWSVLGITPILYKLGAGANAYQELYDGVHKLSNRSNRGALDWQARLADIGGGIPPVDQETTGEIEQALREVYTTRFFINAAKSVEWPQWLNKYKYLDALFYGPELTECDRLLAGWLAENFAIEHPDILFDLISVHGLKVNPFFWSCISREVGINKTKEIEVSALERWVAILLNSAPRETDNFNFMWIAERCSELGAINLTQRIFLFISKHRLTIKPGFAWPDDENREYSHNIDVECPLSADEYILDQLWTKHLKPHIGFIAHPILAGINFRFEEIFQDLKSWGKASRDWDPISYHRSAIEPHKQDEFQDDIDVLINAARETSEWLAINSPEILNSWIELMGLSEVPMLRRLAIHGISILPSKSPDERLYWLLNRIGLHGLMEHHEIFQIVKQNYPMASDTACVAIIDAINAYSMSENGDQSAETLTARAHFDWFSWLIQAKPDCSFLNKHLKPIKERYPQWIPSEFPDLTHWSGSPEWVGSESPWSVAQLLSRAPNEQIKELIEFKGHHFNGPDRLGLVTAINETCKQEKQWAFSLAKVLIDESICPSDIWPAIIGSWQETDLTHDEWRRVLDISSTNKLHETYPFEVSKLLLSLVRDGGKPFSLDLIDQANEISQTVWESLLEKEADKATTDWLSVAINRPTGLIVEFWIHGLSLLMSGRTKEERHLPENYKSWFTQIIEGSTNKEGLGRSILTGQTAFLFTVDETWTRDHILPLFDDADINRLEQAWDGFLRWGRLYPTLAEILFPASMSAISRYRSTDSELRRQFIQFFTTLVVYHVDDPMAQALPELFQHGILNDKINFASIIDSTLRHMESSAKNKLWNRWLETYWRNRLQSVPAPLEETEIRKMLDWLQHLDDFFPAGVTLAVQFPPIKIQHSQLLHTLRTSDLVTRYQVNTAELLIYLCGCDFDYFTDEIGKIAARLLELPQELRQSLDDKLARIGVKRDF